jgi:hypothetical protein
MGEDFLTDSPDQVAHEAERADELFSAMDRMSAVPDPAVMSPEALAEEIAAMRAERRARSGFHALGAGHQCW